MVRPTPQPRTPQPRNAPSRVDLDSPLLRTPETARERYLRIHRSPSFRKLRARRREFVFPVALSFFACYMIYVILAAYAPEFMSQRIFGSITLALLLGVLQFFLTAIVTTAYVSYARRKLDPLVDELVSDEENRR